MVRIDGKLGDIVSLVSTVIWDLTFLKELHGGCQLVEFLH